MTISPRKDEQIGSGATPRNLVERVLAEHIDDSSGRCAACPHSWPVAWRRWPYRLHNLATLARETLATAPAERDNRGTR